MKKILLINYLLLLASVHGFSQTGFPDYKAFESSFAQASEFYFKGDYKSCIQIYDKIIKESPNYLAAYYNRGLAKFYAGDLPGSKGDLEFVSNNGRHSTMAVRSGDRDAYDAGYFLMKNADKFLEIKSRVPEQHTENNKIDDASIKGMTEMATADADDVSESETLDRLTSTKWQFVRVEENGKMFRISQEEYGTEFYFKGDGKVTMTLPKDGTTPGKWKYTHDTHQLSITLEDTPTETWIVKFGVLGNLKLVDKKEGVVMVLEKVKP